MKKSETETSSFGVGSRANHDSSKFYKSKLYNQKKATINDETINKIPDKYLNRIFTKSSQRMTELPDRSVHLMITSPPYNVGKDYDDDLSLDQYLSLIEGVLAETYRVLVSGGRICINIANIGRKPYIPLHSHIIQVALKIGFLMRGEIIWDKGSSAGASTAWGSWMSATNPVLRDTHEYILVFSKDRFDRLRVEDKQSTISKDDFLEQTKSVWSFSTVSAKRIGHPAPFPIELPKRLIELYSFESEVVLDPFLGSGTTAIAALKNKRAYIGYEINPDYVKLAQRRIISQTSQQSIF